MAGSFRDLTYGYHTNGEHCGEDTELASLGITESCSAQYVVPGVTGVLCQTTYFRPM